ncbi:uncharacterized protein [Typha angustifolia]|uniref:uncharacterized protein n=1 Tax=Typha angustifolia TaxID=59011 RepID=UPI003C2BD775
MEAKKASSSSIADELFGRKTVEEEKEVVVVEVVDSSSSFSSSPGYFRSVFPPILSSKVTRNDSPQRSEGLIGHALTLNADDKAVESHAKCPAGSKEGKPIYPDGPSESPYFGSSVHYGGRDFYTASPAKNSSETTTSDGKKKEDDQDSSDFATRGDWWQGSLYY